MKKLLVIIAAFAAAAAAHLRADTSYLLIQGPFGPDDTEATFKWQVNYQPGSLLYGQDLLNAVFGVPSLNGIYGGLYDYYTAGNGIQGAGYIDFDPAPNLLTSPFLVSVTLDSTTVAQDPSYSPGFNYYLAGGGGGARSYDNLGAWTYSDDGTTTRTLTNGSYDGWVFGSTFPAAGITGGNTPTGANFSGATVINAVPEPASVALVLLGVGGLFACPRRRRV